MMISKVTSIPFASKERKTDKLLEMYRVDKVVPGSGYIVQQYDDTIHNLDISKMNSSFTIACKVGEIAAMTNGIERLKGKIRAGEGKIIAKDIKKIEELTDQGQAKIIARVVGLNGLRAKLEAGNNEGAIRGLSDLQAALRAKENQAVRRFVHTLVETDILGTSTPAVTSPEATVNAIEALKEKIQAGKTEGIIAKFKKFEKEAVERGNDKIELISLIPGVDKLAARLEAGNSKDAISGLSGLQDMLLDEGCKISRKPFNIEA